MADYTVLHINNDPEVIGQVRTALSRAGYTIVDAYTGFSGLQAAEEYTPDAILLDMALSDMDGWQIFEALRENAGTATIPVIALTPRAQSINRLVQLQTAGMDETLVKPFTPDELLETVRRAIHGR